MKKLLMWKYRISKNFQAEIKQENLKDCLEMMRKMTKVSLLKMIINIFLKEREEKKSLEK